MEKLTTEELAAAHDREDWNTLWLAALPLVKFTLKKMMRRGELDAGRWADVDLKQEGQLAAGLAVRTWNTLETAFSTHVVTKTRSHLRDLIRLGARGGFGGSGDTPFIVSAQEEVWIDSEPDDEPDAVKQDMFAYAEDEVFLSPETAMDKEIALRLLDRCDSLDADILRRTFGIGCEAQTYSEIAQVTGVSEWLVRQAPARLRQLK